MIKFEHLHTHSHYSLLDGLSGIRPLCERALEHGQASVAVTDHGSIAGVPELFRTARDYGLKAIAGMEAYFTQDASIKEKSSQTYHLTVLARNYEGYQNLCRLVTKSYKDGFYGKPRIDFNMLEEHRRGLIVLSGCVNGLIARTLLGTKKSKTTETPVPGDPIGAYKIANHFYEILGKNNFYLEFMYHGLPDQKTQNAIQLTWMKKNPNLLGVVTQDSHYMFEEDSNVHQTLLCIGSRSKIQAPAFKFDGGPFDYCAGESLSKRFDRKLIEMSRHIADSCESYAIPKSGSMPVLPPSTLQGLSEFKYLDKIAWEGLKKRKLRKGAYVKRLREELTVVSQLKYSAYFIMVADILQWARKQRILVGPGRGSSAGSLLAYCLQITDIDPVIHGLYFERFLNKDRVSPPDIDIDIADSGRQQVLQYVREKYGEAKVAHIGSFSAMGPRQSIRDVAVAHGLGYEQVNIALKEVPHNPMLTFAEVKEMSCVADIPKHIMQEAEVMNGKYRHMSTHAAGIIIDKNVLSDSIPLVIRDGVVQTMYNMDELAKLGYTKFDILGLKTLGIIDNVMKKAHLGKDAWAHMNAFDDSQVYDLICAGNTIGVFQLEGYGYVKMIKRYKPRNFEDIMMINALYRPGPMQGGEGLEIILRRRNQEEQTVYKHASLEPILNNTYGLPVFQEQVMRMCQILADFTLAEADAMRSAIGKKDEVKMAGFRQAFIQGCTSKGTRVELADEIFEDITFFNRYGWNRAHAAAYGAVTYYTAWLKTHFKEYFMSELLNYEDDPIRLTRIKGECHKLNIEFDSVDVNRSEVYYTVTEPSKSLVPGFANVKGIGERAANAIITARYGRKFHSKEDFRNSIPRKLLNKTMYAALENAGGMRDLPEVDNYEKVPF